MSDERDENSSSKRQEEDAKQQHSAAALRSSFMRVDFDILEYLKTIFIVSLPHLALIFVFLIYLLIGASIIREIELNNTNLVKRAVNADVDRLFYFNKRFNSFVNSHERSLAERLNLTLRDLQSFEYNVEQENAKAIKFLKKIIRSEKKPPSVPAANNETAAVETQHVDASKRLIKTFLDFKHEQQQNLNKNLLKLITDENDRFKKQLQIELENAASERKSGNTEDDVAEDSVEKYKFRSSIYFAITLLTTIGYGDVVPHTAVGKLFTSVYSFVGIPLTFILLTDIGSIFTHFLKFLYIFLVDLYKIGYFNSIFNFIKTASSKLISLFSARSTARKNINNKQRNKKRDESVHQQHQKDSNQEEPDEDRDRDKSKSVERSSIITIAFDCYDKSNNLFDFPLVVLVSLIFIYLTIGSFIYSHNQQQLQYAVKLDSLSSIVDGYYFNLMSLMKIGFGDLQISLAKSSLLYLIAFYVYILLGISFFMLVIEYFKNRLKLILIKAGRNIIYEILKFAKQLGYQVDFHHDETLVVDMSSTCDISTSTSSGIASSLGTSLSEKSLSSDEPAQQQQMRRRSSLLQKRKSILKDLNEFKLLSSGYTGEKCDKQTQITTLLCSKYKGDIVSNFSSATPIIRINAAPIAPIGTPPTVINTTPTPVNSPQQLPAPPPSPKFGPNLEPIKEVAATAKTTTITNTGEEEESTVNLKLNNKDRPVTPTSVRRARFSDGSIPPSSSSSPIVNRQTATVIRSTILKK